MCQRSSPSLLQTMRSWSPSRVRGAGVGCGSSSRRRPLVGAIVLEVSFVPHPATEQPQTPLNAPPASDSTALHPPYLSLSLCLCTDLPDWAQPAFGGMTSLNRVQSRVSDCALYSSENMLVCAPTGEWRSSTSSTSSPTLSMFVGLLTLLHSVHTISRATPPPICSCPPVYLTLDTSGSLSCHHLPQVPVRRT